MTGLIAVHVLYGIAFTTLFFRNFYVAIPDELVKAAKGKTYLVMRAQDLLNPIRAMKQPRP